MDKYPARPPFFANRFCRLLIKQAVANDIGAVATMLLNVIALTEDSKRYTGKVTFHNEHLMPLCGCGSYNQFNRARKLAIDAGWLKYEPPKRGSMRPGKYWVCIPRDHENIPDGPCDENPEEYQSPDDSAKRSSSGDHEVTGEAMIARNGGHEEFIGSSSGDHEVIIGSSFGEHSNLNLKPNPKPKPRDRIRGLKKLAFEDWQPDDLRDDRRLESLAGELSELGPPAYPPSEATRMNIFAAAERALEVGKNPIALFMDILREQRWHVITADQEDRAAKRLANLQRAGPGTRKDHPVTQTTQKLADSLGAKYDASEGIDD